MASILDLAFLFFVGAFLPWLVVKSALQQERAEVVLPPKEKAIWSTIVFLAVTGALACFTASRRGDVLFGPWAPTVLEVTAGGGLLILLLATRIGLASWIREGQRKNTMSIMPKTWRDLPLWVVLSCSAGFIEEIVYRGVLYQVLLDLSGSVTLAVVLACTVFGVAHFRQGHRAVVFITLLSTSLHGLVIGFGTLYLAMIVHAAYDVCAGLSSILKKETDG